MSTSAHRAFIYLIGSKKGISSAKEVGVSKRDDMDASYWCRVWIRKVTAT